MYRWMLTLLVLLCAAALAPAAQVDALAPVSATEAERMVAEERDFLTDVLWIGVDEYFHTGDWQSCVRLCDEVTLLDPQFVEAYTSAAWVLWNYDRDKEAVATYERGLAANPESAELAFDFGFYYRDRKQYDKAISMFRQAVKNGATQTQQHMLPNTLEQAGRKAEALAEWRQLLRRFPKDPVAKNKIARLERELIP